MLHILRSSAFSNNNISQCIANLQVDDSVIFMDDGCYNVNHSSLSIISDKLSTIYMIEQHAKARAIQSTTLVKSIDLKQLMVLVFDHQSVVTWQ